MRVRSGRHALDKNLSTVSDGIVIDVSDMNKVFLDEKRGSNRSNRHSRRPACKGLAREGFMAPFGDSPTVGIGGITMGGGFGVLSRSIGLISDNLLALKMVDAKGRIIQANQSRNEDLLWASRGGGEAISDITPNIRSKFIVPLKPQPSLILFGRGNS